MLLDSPRSCCLDESEGRRERGNRRGGYESSVQGKSGTEEGRGQGGLQDICMAVVGWQCKLYNMFINSHAKKEETRNLITFGRPCSGISTNANDVMMIISMRESYLA